MKALTCPNCGGAINKARKICVYCGTQFEFEENEIGVIRFEQYTSPVRNLRMEARIPRELIEFGEEEQVIGYAKRQIAEQMVDKMLQGDMIEFTSEMDWRQCQQVINARLRILSPSYRF